MDDKEVNQSFLYPSLGGDEKEGSDAQAWTKDVDYDVTGTDPVPGECGLGACRPRCFQKFRTIGCFTAVYSFSSIMTSAITIYINSQITTLEKHFNFNSSVSGFLMSCNDFGYFLTCLFLSYLARRIHIPRGLALSTFLYGISGILCTIPYFGTKDQLNRKGLSVYSNESTESPTQLCMAKGSMMSSSVNNVTSCDPGSETGGIHGISDHWRTLAIAIIAIGMTVQGAAKSPRHSFVGVYIDDNVPKTKTSWYLGVIIGLGILGPAIAFIMGGLFSSVYITLEETNLSNRDPRWLGAWWLGFLLFGSVSLVVGIPLLFFPRKLRVRQEIEKAERKRKAESEGKNKLVWEMKGFLKTSLKLVSNPMYMLLTVSVSLVAMAIGGGMAFIPKYMEVQFNVPTWKVNIVLGALNVGGAALGSVIGGLVISKFKLSPLSCLKMAVTITALTLVAELSGFVIKCDQPSFYSGPEGVLGNGSMSCSPSCHCDTESYFPVCGDDGHNYYSPCYAGCTNVVDDGKIFKNCSCLSSPNLTQAVGGLCEDSCQHKFWIYVVVMFVTGLASSLSIMPGFIASIRTVEEAQKPMAIGLRSFLASLIGWCPGPIVFGLVVDTTCLISQASSCNTDSAGACLLYDLDAFRTRVLGLFVCLKAGSFALLLCALLYASIFSSKNVFQSHTDDEDYDANEENINSTTSKSTLPSFSSSTNGFALQEKNGDVYADDKLKSTGIR